MATAAYLLQGGLDAIRARVLTLIGERVDVAIGANLHEAILEAPLRSARPDQETLQPFRDLDAIRNFLSGPGATAIFDMPWLPVYLLVCYLLHPLLGQAATLAAVLLLGIAALTELRGAGPMRRALEAQSRRSMSADNTQRGAEAVRAMGMLPALTERWQAAHVQHLTAQRRASFIVGDLSSLTRMTRLIVQSTMLGLGAYLAIQGEISSGTTTAAFWKAKPGFTQLQLTSKDDQKRGLLERIEQLRQEVTGLQEQQKSYAGQLEIARTDLADLQPLYESAIFSARASALCNGRRSVIRGAVGDAVARIAQTQARIAETDLQISQNGHYFIAGIIKELRDTETKITELQEKRIAAEDQLQRLEIRAPLSGIVHQLAVHTIGGVLAPGDVLMQIVPSAGRVIVEIRVKPSDIDQLTVGRETRVRFSSFDRGATDELQGVLFRVGADLSQDRQTGLPYYSASIRVDDSELAKLGELKLVPGMPAEAFIKTDKRTIASYLIKPLHDQMQRGLRER